MKTLVFCTSYAAGGEDWARRYRRWLQHHGRIDWGEAVLCMIDDASPFTPPPEEIGCWPTTAMPAAAAGPVMLRFAERLGRSATTDYPGWWRSFLFSSLAARHFGCRRIVHIESDTYVLTARLAGFLRSRQQGWTAFWCPRWNFPETCLQVICEDQFPRLQSMWTRGWQHYAGQLAERVLPFTEVVREPHGNRYGEFRTRIPGYADFAAQVRPEQAVWYR